MQAPPNEDLMDRPSLCQAFPSPIDRRYRVISQEIQNLTEAKTASSDAAASSSRPPRTPVLFQYASLHHSVRDGHARTAEPKESGHSLANNERSLAGHLPPTLESTTHWTETYIYTLPPHTFWQALVLSRRQPWEDYKGGLELTAQQIESPVRNSVARTKASPVSTGED